MAQAFNLTAQLNLRGPSNVRQIVSDVKKQLGTITGDIKFNIDPSAINNTTKLSKSLQQLSSDLSSVSSNATAAASAIKNFGQSINSISNSSNKLSSNINKTISSSGNLGTTVTKTAKNISVARTEMEEFGRQSALAIRRFAAFSAVTGVFFSLNRAINSGLKSFIEFDKELVRLQQVTGQSADGLKGLQDEITRLSTGLGVSSDSLIQVSSTLAQAGLSARETEQALKALALTELAPSFDDINQTVEGSIALMRQFGIAAKDLEKALGSVNSVAAAFAVESSDIIAAIQRTGGVFATASKGVSEGADALNEFIAVFTSVRATTRESAETIATGLRTIFTRIQRQGTIEALKEFGVTLTDAEGKFVGAYKAVQLLSEGLSSIDPRDIRFSQIVEELGGFRQIGKVIPLIQQFATAQDALRVAQAGQGSLAADAAKAQLSLANQIAKVREEFLTLIRSLGQSDTFQTLARGALTFASGLIKITDAVKGVLPSLAILAAGASFRGLSQFTSGFIGGLKKVPKGGPGAQQPQSVVGSIGRNIGSSLVGAKTEQVSRDLDQNSAALDKLSGKIDSLVSSMSSINGLTSGITALNTNLVSINSALASYNSALLNNTNALSSNSSSLENVYAALVNLDATLDRKDFGGGGPTTASGGGRILGFSKGGSVPGSGRGDKVPALLEPGEVVMSNRAVNKYGRGNLVNMNKRYFKGGIAREKLQTLVEKSNSIKKYINDTINPDDEALTKIVPFRVDLDDNDFREMKQIMIDTERQRLRYLETYRDDPTANKQVGQRARSSKDPRTVVGFLGLKKPESHWGPGNAFQQHLIKRLNISPSDMPPNLGTPQEQFKDIIDEHYAVLDYQDGDAKFWKDLSYFDTQPGKIDILNKQFKNVVNNNQLKPKPTPNYELFTLPDTRVYYPEIGTKEQFMRDYAAFTTADYAKTHLPAGAYSIGGKIQKFAGGGEALQSKLSTIRTLLGEFYGGDEQLISKSISNSMIIDEARADKIIANLESSRSQLPLFKKLFSEKSSSVGVLNGFPIARYGAIGGTETMRFDELKDEETIREFIKRGKLATQASRGPVGKRIVYGDQKAARRRFAVGGTVEGIAAKEKKSIETVILEQLSSFGDASGVKKILGLGAGEREISSILNASNIRAGKNIEKAIKFINRALAKTGKQDAAREAKEAAMRKVAIAGLFPLDYNKDFSDWKLEDGREIYGYVRGFQSSFLPQIEAMQEANRATRQKFAEDIQDTAALGGLGNRNIQGPIQPLAIDFDETLALGTKMLDENGEEDLPAYSDRKKVMESLAQARPTSLAKRLASIEQKNPGYVRMFSRILTARPQSTADIIASTLNRFGLPYLEQDVTGVSQGLGTNIAKAKAADVARAEKLIDDNEKNIRATMAAGKSTFRYGEVPELKGPAEEKFGQSNIEGGMLEAALSQLLGYNINVDALQRNRAIDFPNGLGRGAQLFGLPPNIETEVKRTLDGDSFSKAREEFSRYFKENPQAFAKGGTATFGSGAFKFPKRISNAYVREMEKLLEQEQMEKVFSTYPGNERMVVDEEAVKKGYESPFTRELFINSFKDKINRNTVFERMGQFARVIGLPPTDLLSAIPTQLDFGVNYPATALFSKDPSGPGTRGLQGVDLTPYGYTEQDKQDLFGYTKLIEEKKKQILKTIKTPVTTYEDGSFSYDTALAEKLRAELDDLQKQQRSLIDKNNAAIKAAKESRLQSANQSGRGSVGIATNPFNTSQRQDYSILYHELTHQLFNSLRTKNAQSFEAYKAKVSSLFSGNNDDVADAFDALVGNTGYNSADVAYGRSYKLSGLSSLMIGSAKESFAKYVNSDPEYIPELRKTWAATNSTTTAKAFKPLNPKVNDILLRGKISQDVIDKYEDNGKEEFLTTLIQKLPLLDENLSGVLDSTLDDLLGGAGISRQKFALGGLADSKDAMSGLMQGLYGNRNQQTDKKEKDFGKISITEDGDMLSVGYLKNDSRSGYVQAMKYKDNLWYVGLSKATKGYGPRLYDVAMEAVTEKGAMLTSDRSMVSADAQKVWAYYFKNRGDVKKTPLEPENWTKNQALIDPKLYGRRETWPPATDPAWILQSGYSKSPTLLNDPEQVKRNNNKAKKPIDSRSMALSYFQRADGGPISRFADGGSVPALVSNGEAYVPPKLAKRIGYGTLDRMNQADKNGMGRFSDGGISVFKGPGSGTSDSIPTNLPVGSFIIREKATKALGLNSGGIVGIRRFKDGDKVSYGRKDTTGIRMPMPDLGFLKTSAILLVDSFRTTEQMISNSYSAWQEIDKVAPILAKTLDRYYSTIDATLDDASLMVQSYRAVVVSLAKQGKTTAEVDAIMTHYIDALNKAIDTYQNPAPIESPKSTTTYTVTPPRPRRRNRSSLSPTPPPVPKSAEQKLAAVENEAIAQRIESKERIKSEYDPLYRAASSREDKQAIQDEARLKFQAVDATIQANKAAQQQIILQELLAQRAKEANQSTEEYISGLQQEIDTRSINIMEQDFSNVLGPDVPSTQEARQQALSETIRSRGLQAFDVTDLGQGTNIKDIISQISETKNKAQAAATANDYLALRARLAGQSLEEYSQSLSDQALNLAEQFKNNLPRALDSFQEQLFDAKQSLENISAREAKGEYANQEGQERKAIDISQLEESIGDTLENILGENFSGDDRNKILQDIMEKLKNADSTQAFNVQSLSDAIKQISTDEAIASRATATVAAQNKIQPNQITGATAEALKSRGETQQLFKEIDKISAKFSKFGLAIGAAGSVIAKFIDATESRSAAMAAAAISGGTSTASTLAVGVGQGLQTLKDLSDPKGLFGNTGIGKLAGSVLPGLKEVLTGPFGIIAGAGISLAAAFKDAYNAAREFDKQLNTKTVENSLSKVGTMFDQFGKDMSQKDLLGDISKELNTAISAAMKNINIDATVPKMFWVNMIDAAMGGSEAAQRSIVLEKQGVGAYFNTIMPGGNQQLESYMSDLAPQLASQQSASLKPAAENAFRLFEQQLRTGSSSDDIMDQLKTAGGGVSQFATAIARSNPIIEEQIIKTQARADISDTEKQKIVDSIIAREAEKQTILNTTATLRQIEFEKLNKGTDSFVNSLERIYSNMEMSINKASFDIQKLSASADLASEALSGNAKAGQINLEAINVLQNRRAYSPEQQNQAVDLAGSFFGSTSPAISSILNIGDKLESTILQTINRTRGAEPGATNERVLASIRSALDRQLTDLQIPDSLVPSISNQIRDALKDISTQGDLDTVNFNEIAEKVPALTKQIDAARRAQETAVRALEFYQSQLNEYANAMNSMVELQFNASKDFARASDIISSSSDELSKAFGREISLRDTLTQSLGKTRRQTGGATDPVDISRNITNLENSRKILQGASETAAAKGPAAQDEFKIMQDRLRNNNLALRQNFDALKNLADSSEIASAALNKIQEIQQRRQAGANLIEKLVTSSPEEINKLNSAIARLQNNMMGVANVGTTSEQRGESLQAFNMIAPLLGEGAKQNELRANVLESMLLESGQGVNPMFAQVLDSLRNPEGDPEMQEAISVYKEGVNLQASANSRLGEIKQLMLENTADAAAEKLKVAMQGVKFTFEETVLSDIRSEIINLKKLVEKRGPAAAGLANGGIVYASNGRMIDFQSKGTDTVPAMLTPGEFVVNRASTKRNLPLLQSINKNKGGKVNYLADGGIVPGFGWSNRKTETELRRNRTDTDLETQDRFMVFQDDKDPTSRNDNFKEYIIGPAVSYKQGPIPEEKITGGELKNLSVLQNSTRIHNDTPGFFLKTIKTFYSGSSDEYGRTALPIVLKSDSSISEEFRRGLKNITLFQKPEIISKQKRLVMPQIEKYKEYYSKLITKLDNNINFKDIIENTPKDTSDVSIKLNNSTPYNVETTIDNLSSISKDKKYLLDSNINDFVKDALYPLFTPGSTVPAGWTVNNKDYSNSKDLASKIKPEILPKDYDLIDIVKENLDRLKRIDINNPRFFQETQGSQNRKENVSLLKDFYDGKLFSIQLDDSVLDGEKAKGKSLPLTLYNINNEQDWLDKIRNYQDELDKIDPEMLSKTLPINPTNFIRLDDKINRSSKIFPWTGKDFNSITKIDSENFVKDSRGSFLKNQYFGPITTENQGDEKSGLMFPYKIVSKGTTYDESIRGFDRPLEKYMVISSDTKNETAPFANLTKSLYIPATNWDDFIIDLKSQIEANQKDPTTGYDFNYAFNPVNSDLNKYMSAPDIRQAQENHAIVPSTDGTLNVNDIFFRNQAYSDFLNKKEAEEAQSKAIDSAKKKFRVTLEDTEAFTNAKKVGVARALFDIGKKQLGLTSSKPTNLDGVRSVISELSQKATQLSKNFSKAAPNQRITNPQWLMNDAYRAFFVELYKGQYSGKDDDTPQFLKGLGLPIDDADFGPGANPIDVPGFRGKKESPYRDYNAAALGRAQTAIKNIINREIAMKSGTAFAGKLSDEDKQKLKISSSDARIYKEGSDTFYQPGEDIVPKSYQQVAEIGLNPRNVFPTETFRSDNYLNALQELYKTGTDQNGNLVFNYGDPSALTAAKSIDILKNWYTNYQDKYLNLGADFAESQVSLQDAATQADLNAYKESTAQPAHAFLTGNKYGVLPDSNRLLDQIQLEIKEPIKRARGGLIYASNGTLVNFQPKGTDTVPAMLTPGEFVVNRAATQKNLPLLQSINSGKYANGGVVYAQNGGSIRSQSFSSGDDDSETINAIYTVTKATLSGNNRLNQLIILTNDIIKNLQALIDTNSYLIPINSNVQDLTSYIKTIDFCCRDSVSSSEDRPKDVQDSAPEGSGEPPQIPRPVWLDELNNIPKPSWLPINMEPNYPEWLPIIIDRPIWLDELTNLNKTITIEPSFEIPIPLEKFGCCKDETGQSITPLPRYPEDPNQPITPLPTVKPPIFAESSYQPGEKQLSAKDFPYDIDVPKQIDIAPAMPSRNSRMDDVDERLGVNTPEQSRRYWAEEERAVDDRKRVREETNTNRASRSLDVLKGTVGAKDAAYSTIETIQALQEGRGLDAAIGGLSMIENISNISPLKMGPVGDIAGIAGSATNIARGIYEATGGNFDRLQEQGLSDALNIAQNTSSLAGTTGLSKNLGIAGVVLQTGKDVYEEITSTPDTVDAQQRGIVERGLLAATTGSGDVGGSDLAKLVGFERDSSADIMAAYYENVLSKTAQGATVGGVPGAIVGLSTATAGEVYKAGSGLARDTSVARESQAKTDRMLEESKTKEYVVDDQGLLTQVDKKSDDWSMGIDISTESAIKEVAILQDRIQELESAQNTGSLSYDNQDIASAISLEQEKLGLAQQRLQNLAVQQVDQENWTFSELGTDSPEVKARLDEFNSRLAAAIDQLGLDIVNNLDQAKLEQPVTKNKGGLIYASNGTLVNFRPKGTDTIPAMLTPGEFVINRNSTQKYRPVLEAINNGNYNRGGIVNYLNKGGYIPEYKFIGGLMGSAGSAIPSFDFTKYLNSLVGSISSSITEAFDKAVSSLKQPNNAAGGVSNNGADLTSIDNFVNRLNNIANILSNIYIPPQITITGKHDVVVTINGDTVLNQLRPDIAGIVISAIRGAFADLKAKNPENNTIDFNIDIDPRRFT